MNFERLLETYTYAQFQHPQTSKISIFSKCLDLEYIIIILRYFINEQILIHL